MYKKYLKYMAMMAALTTGVACSTIDEDLETNSSWCMNSDSSPT